MADLIAVAATTLAAVFLLPQIVRLVRHDNTAGVSTTWAAFGVITNLAWVLYLGALGHWIAVIAPGLAVVTYGVTLVVIAVRSQGRAWIFTAGLYASAFAAVAPLGGIVAVGMVLTFTPVIQLTPGVLAVFRTRHPSGVSPLTWSLSAAEGALWGVYGWLVADLALLGYGLMTGVGSLLILGRTLATRPRWKVVPVRV